jgi:hypothetical protein
MFCIQKQRSHYYINKIKTNVDTAVSSLFLNTEYCCVDCIPYYGNEPSGSIKRWEAVE